LNGYRKYQYVKIGDRYFCLQQNLAVLAWILFIKKAFLRFSFGPFLKKKSQRLKAQLYHDYKLFKYKFKVSILFLLYKHNLRNGASIIELPIYGQMCIPTHKGYKIIDYYRGRVTKIFNPDVDVSSISNEIEKLRKLSRIDFAPSIKRWNIKERWYEEDYIDGTMDSPYVPPNSSELLKKFHSGIALCIDSLIFSYPQITKNVSEYLKEFIEILEYDTLSNQGLTKGEIDKIKNFFNPIIKQLRNKASHLVFYFVWTHGDFCSSNMMNTKYGIRVLDWEEAMYRSTLFDFYSYFFHRTVSRKLPIEEVVSDIKEVLPIVISRFASKAPDISKSLLTLEDTYRYLYYIERICMLIERITTDSREIFKGYIFRSIEAFTRYEEILSSA
jgi:thiamine kinase-like enzyme